MTARALPALGLLLLPAMAFGFSRDVHVALTRQALAESGFDAAAAEAVVAGNLRTDDVEYSTPAAHFDDEAFSAGSERLRAREAAAVAALGDCDPAAAREELGRVLHAVQDFFAHTNWVETHAESDPIDLLNMADPAQDLRCDAKTHQGGLTSGYWPDDQRPSPRKCIHAELNKDTPDRPFHEAARLRALAESKATVARLERAAASRFTAVGPREPAYRLRLLKDESRSFAARRLFCPKIGAP